MSHPLVVWLLIIGFAWTALKGIEKLIWPGKFADYVLMKEAKFSWLFFLIALLIIMSHSLAVWDYIKLASRATTVGLVALGIGAVESILNYRLAIKDLELTRRVCAASRRARGLSVNKDTLTKMISPSGMRTSLIISLVIITIGVGLVLVAKGVMR